LHQMFHNCSDSRSCSCRDAFRSPTVTTSHVTAAIVAAATFTSAFAGADASDVPREYAKGGPQYAKGDVSVFPKLRGRRKSGSTRDGVLINAVMKVLSSIEGCATACAMQA
jgi:hypothetical protein